MTRFLIMRHARTEWNEQRRIQGVTDTRLSRAGREQAAQWAKQLEARPFDAVLSSPLSRTMETARTVNSRGLLHTTHQDLREQDWGHWTGCSAQKLRGELGEEVRRMEAMGFDFRPPGGESRREVAERAAQALKDIARDNPGRTLLTVTHNGVILALLASLQGLSYLPHEPLPYITYRLHTVVCEDGALRVESINETI